MRDVTAIPSLHGDVELGVNYVLLHDAYILRGSGQKFDQLHPPTRYGTDALEEARRVFGDARKAPPEFASLKAEADQLSAGLSTLPVPPAEVLNLKSDVKVVRIVPQGTRLTVYRVLVVSEGERSDWVYLATLSGIADAAQVDVVNVTNYGHYGFLTTTGRGYSPNPLMLGLAE